MSTIVNAKLLSKLAISCLVNDLINDLILQTKIHAKNSGRYRKACQDHEDMLPDVAYAECKSLCYKTYSEESEL